MDKESLTQHFAYLDALHAAGAVDMIYAGRFLADVHRLGQKEADHVLFLWNFARPGKTLPERVDAAVELLDDFRRPERAPLWEYALLLSIFVAVVAYYFLAQPVRP